VKQLRFQEPWADLLHGSSEEALKELLIRVDVLEKRVTQLEKRLEETHLDEAIEEPREQVEPVAV
jgi:hypothetical protein